MALNFPLEYIQEANDHSFSDDEKQQWGNYYKHNPCIYYINVEKTIAILKKYAPEVWLESMAIAEKYTQAHKQDKRPC